MMTASRALKKPAPMTAPTNMSKLYNKLLDMVPGWTDNSLASGSKFLEVISSTLWKVKLNFKNYHWVNLTPKQSTCLSHSEGTCHIIVKILDGLWRDGTAGRVIDWLVADALVPSGPLGLQSSNLSGFVQMALGWYIINSIYCRCYFSVSSVLCFCVVFQYVTALCVASNKLLIRSK